MSETDDPFGDDPQSDEFDEEIERHRTALFERITDYMDEVELDAGLTVQLLIGTLVGLRMTAYGMSVENPSVAGLKLDLDRLRREIDGYLREVKKGAEDYIVHVKEAWAAAEKEAEEGDEDEDGEERE